MQTGLSVVHVIANLFSSVVFTCMRSLQVIMCCFLQEIRGEDKVASGPPLMMGERER